MASRKGKNKTNGSAGKKDTQAAVAATGKKNQPESAVPVTPTPVSNSKKGARNHSPVRRGPTGASLENASSPVKDNMRRTTSTSLINNSSVERRGSNSSTIVAVIVPLKMMIRKPRKRTGEQRIRCVRMK
jgi:hypothetical protein